MGLDNIPHVYPCQVQQRAVTDDTGAINCQATIGAGGCPWNEQYVSDGRPGTPAYGILGTFCWWRGAVSRDHLDLLAGHGHDLPSHLVDGFYGEGDEGRLTARYCVELAEFLEGHLDLFGSVAPDDLPSYRYAIWWLRWVAECGDGADAWW